jgi:A/G-specific adenine glycosylase
VLIPAPRRNAIRRRLLAWYDAGHRDLPWRFPQDAADPYKVWLAEVMLQQTQVAAVIPYYRRFLVRWATLEALANARDEEVLAAWSGLGYYARCRNLLAAAREALRRHGGLPASVEALRALPGFGRYTAGAVASIAFGVPAPVVDGNVARVLARAFLLDGDPADRRMQERLWALASELVSGSEGERGAREGRPHRPPRPGDFNQALMELGATVCRKPEPVCGQCPVARLCEARRAGRQAEVPPARRRPARRSLRVACAVVERNGKLLLAQREGRGLFGGLWELPSAEVCEGLSPRVALARAMAGRFGVPVVVGCQLASKRRMLTHRQLELEAYRCRLRAGPRPAGGGELRWVERARVGDTGMSSAMRSLLEVATARRKRQARRLLPGSRSKLLEKAPEVPKNA